MTTYYFFDTSALVKRYHIKAGSDRVDEVFDDEEGIFLISDLIVVGFRSGFIQQARALVLERNIRTLDALQLAAVLEFEPLAPVFVCADDRLNDAAGAVGFTVLNPQSSL